MLFDLDKASNITKGLYEAFIGNAKEYKIFYDRIAEKGKVSISSGGSSYSYNFDLKDVDIDRFIDNDIPYLKKLHLFENDDSYINYDLENKAEYTFKSDVINYIYNDDRDYDGMLYLSPSEHKWLSETTDEMRDIGVDVERIRFVINMYGKETININRVSMDCSIKSKLGNEIYRFNITERLDRLCVKDIFFNKKAYIESEKEGKDESIDAIVNRAKMIDKRLKACKDLLYESIISEKGSLLYDKQDISDEIADREKFAIKTLFLRQRYARNKDNEINYLTVPQTSIIKAKENGSIVYQVNIPNEIGEYDYPVKRINIDEGMMIDRFDRVLIDVKGNIDMNVDVYALSPNGLSKQRSYQMSIDELNYRFNKLNEKVEEKRKELETEKLDLSRNDISKEEFLDWMNENERDVENGKER